MSASIEDPSLLIQKAEKYWEVMNEEEREEFRGLFFLNMSDRLLELNENHPLSREFKKFLDNLNDYQLAYLKQNYLFEGIERLLSTPKTQ